MLELASRPEAGRAPGSPAGEAETPAPALVRTVATTGAGVPELTAALAALRAAPPAVRAARRRRQAERQVIAIAGEVAREAARAALGPLAALIDDVVARRVDPWTAAARLARGSV